MASRKKLAVVGLAIAAVAVAAYANLPSTSVPPATVPYGTLAGKTAVNVLSVDAFTRAINQDHGTNGVLQHLHFAPGQSTGWHRHPGPNIVVVVAGGLTLIDEHCNETTYGPGQGFATGLDLHEAIAGSAGADFYTVYFLPADATDLRESETPAGCATR